MADKKPSMSLLNTVVVFAFIGGLLVWLALVLTSSGEQRLDNACKPVEYTTDFLHEVVTAVIGRQPTWTLYTQNYLMTGCLYSFSVLMSQKLPSADDEATFGGATTEPEAAVGGIR
jgi:hypothetical protein